MITTHRTNYYQASPQAMKALIDLETATRRLTIPQDLQELVKMRVSQINGCAYCLDVHGPKARKAGVPQQKLDVLAAWRESPVFAPRERAALLWAESLTRIEQTGAADADFAALAEQFDAQEQVDLTLVITTINAWNRFAVGFRVVHPERAATEG